MRSSNQNSNLCLDIFTENAASMQYYRDQEACLRKGRPEHQRMLRVLEQAMKQELTPRQIACIQAYYFEEMKMSEVAQRLGIDTSSVSRHLKRARERLARVMGYAFERLEHCDIPE